MRKIATTIVLTLGLVFAMTPANADAVVPDCGSGVVITLETGCKVPDGFPAELRPVTTDIVSLFYQLQSAMDAEVQHANATIDERDHAIAAQAEAIAKQHATIRKLRATIHRLRSHR